MIYSSFGIATGWTTKESRLNSRQEQEIFLSSIMSRPALEPTQPPVQWVPGAVYPGIKRQGVKLTTLLHLVPMLRMVELYLHSPIHFHGVVLN
jgi:hypothetical protein